MALSERTSRIQKIVRHLRFPGADPMPSISSVGQLLYRSNRLLSIRSTFRCACRVYVLRWLYCHSQRLIPGFTYSRNWRPSRHCNQNASRKTRRDGHEAGEPLSRCTSPSKATITQQLNAVQQQSTLRSSLMSMLYRATRVRRGDTATRAWTGREDPCNGITAGETI